MMFGSFMGTLVWPPSGERASRYRGALIETIAVIEVQPRSAHVPPVWVELRAYDALAWRLTCCRAGQWISTNGRIWLKRGPYQSTATAPHVVVLAEDLRTAPVANGPSVVPGEVDATVRGVLRDDVELYEDPAGRQHAAAADHAAWSARTA